MTDVEQNIEEQTIAVVKGISQQAEGMTDKELLNTMYLDKGLIDSFQVVRLITRLEDDFGIRFSAEDLSSKRFRTLKGVAEIIKEFMGDKQ